VEFLIGYIFTSCCGAQCKKKDKLKIIKMHCKGPFNKYVTHRGGVGGLAEVVTLCDRGGGGSRDFVTVTHVYTQKPMYHTTFKISLYPNSRKN